MTKLRKVIKEFAPHCISAYRLAVCKPLRAVECVSRAYQVSLGTLDVASIWGYDLRKYNNTYLGPIQFVSPISLSWGGMPADVIFDSEMHGYHGEIGSPASYRGSGDSEPFVCERCQFTSFKIFTKFDYIDACQDLLDDEPDIEIQDYFTNILIAGECVKCRTMSTVVDMDV